MKNLHDISPLISPRLAVFPGDTPVSREVLLDMKRGDNITLSTLRSTVHLGAHVDAPAHYGVDGATIESMPLDRCIGPCQVITCARTARDRIDFGDLTAEVTQPRILLRTASYPDPEQWDGSFAGLAPALIDALHEKGVFLVGVDTPSVDPADSKSLEAHLRFLAHEMTILEGLVLRDVPDGEYELIALPLKLDGFDGSPVRAVLREG